MNVPGGVRKGIKEEERLDIVEKAKGYGATYKQILAIQNGASIESLGNLSNELDGALSMLQQNYEKRKGEEGRLEEKTIKIEKAKYSWDTFTKVLLGNY
jgi:hypothetical protein